MGSGPKRAQIKKTDATRGHLFLPYNPNSSYEKIIKIRGLYVVHIKRRDNPYVVHFICRDSPCVVHFKRRDCPYV